VAPLASLLTMYELTHPEFCYLLRLLEAPGLFGLDPVSVAPDDARDELGRTRLEQRGYLRRLGEQGPWNIDTELVLAVSVCAASELVVVSARFDENQARVCLWHHLAQGLVVERSIVGGLCHRLVLISDLATLLGRIVDWLGLRARRYPRSFGLTVSVDEFAELNRSLLTSGPSATLLWLRERGLSLELARGFSDALLCRAQAGAVSIVHQPGSERGSQRDILLYSGSESSWSVQAAGVRRGQLNIALEDRSSVVQRLAAELGPNSEAVRSPTR
jgi:hypothetical protein